MEEIKRMIEELEFTNAKKRLGDKPPSKEKKYYMLKSELFSLLELVALDGFIGGKKFKSTDGMPGVKPFPNFDDYWQQLRKEIDN